MHKHRIFIIVAAALAIISSFLPWGSFNAGAFGSYSVSGTHGGDGWFIIVLSYWGHRPSLPFKYYFTYEQKFFHRCYRYRCTRIHLNSR